MKTELKYGIILGLGICFYVVIVHLLGFYTTSIQAGKYTDVIILILPVTIFFLAILEKRRQNNYLTLWQGLRTGVLTAIISYPISAIFLWIYHHFINPNWSEYLIGFQREQLLSAGLSTAEIEQQIDRMRAANGDLVQIVSGLVGTILMSLILSFIISLILRKRRISNIPIGV